MSLCARLHSIEMEKERGCVQILLRREHADFEVKFRLVIDLLRILPPILTLISQPWIPAAIDYVIPLRFHELISRDTKLK